VTTKTLRVVSLTREKKKTEKTSNITTWYCLGLNTLLPLKTNMPERTKMSSQEVNVE
jgi:hypothetical protein